MTDGSAVVGPQQDCTGPSSRWCAENCVVVYSQTLPIISTSPNSLGGKVPTGEVPTQPSAPSLRYGNRPCQVLAINRPLGMASSPHEYTEVAPPRAAYSHSASVGRRRPAQRAYASASGKATCTTGWSSRSSIPLSEPNGRRQLAPGAQRHHCRQLRRSTGPLVGRNTSAPGTSSCGAAPANCVGSSSCSATVT